MKATEDDLGEMMARANARPRSDRTDCPSSETLVRAGEGTGSGVEEGLVEHLASCSDCAVEYRLATALRPWAHGAAAALAATALDEHQAVRETRRRLILVLAAAVLACLGLAGGVTALWQQRRGLETRVAAAEQETLRNAEGARLGRIRDGEIAALRRQLEGFDRPQTNVPIVDLFPRDVARGEEATMATLDLSPGTPFVVLILNVPAPTHQTSYFIELRDASGNLAWAGHHRLEGDKALTLGVPTHLLSKDAYRIQLYSEYGERRQVLEQYALRVRRR
jgi:hypothetical protein